MINLIWAMDVNWLIGTGNKLPWRYLEDLIYFKKKTHNKVVIMGDKTYRSLKDVYYKDRKLPFKKVYVGTLDFNKTYQDATKVNDISKFLKEYDGEIWVLGGATIYKLALPFADNLYITWILKEHQGDFYFPKFSLETDFKLLKEKQGKTKELKFTVYGRVK